MKTYTLHQLHQQTFHISIFKTYQSILRLLSNSWNRKFMKNRSFASSSLTFVVCKQNITHMLQQEMQRTQEYEVFEFFVYICINQFISLYYYCSCKWYFNL